MLRLFLVLLLSSVCGVLQLPALPLPQSGGLEIVLAADLPAGSYTPEVWQATASAISARLAQAGYGQALVEVSSGTTLIVRLPAVDEADSADILPLITQTGLLEFVDMSGLQSQTQEMVGQQISTTAQSARGLPFRDGALLNPLTGELFSTVLTGDALQTASAQSNDIQGWLIAFELTPEGGEVFAAFTAAHIGQPLAIVLDGEVLSVPVIQDQLGVSGVIAGNFSEQEAQNLALQLRAGALPVPVQVTDIHTYRSGQ